MIETLRINHSVAERNAQYAADAKTERYARILENVRLYLEAGYSLDRALQTVQRTENAAALADGLDYGPFANVARIWELHTKTPHVACRTIPAHAHVLVATDMRHHDTGEWVQRCVVCGNEI